MTYSSEASKTSALNQALHEMILSRWMAASVMIAVLLTAFALRFHELGAQSLWHDEGNSYAQSVRMAGEIAEHAARDIHPPGYYWLLAVWRLVAGESEFSLRAISALAGVITVALAFALGKRLYGGWAGVLASLLAALNTFTIYYGQEARMYALLALLAAAGMAAVIGLIERPTWQRAALLAFINAAGLYAQYGYPLFMLAQGVLALLWIAQSLAKQHKGDHRGSSRAVKVLLYYITANVIALALFLPWLPTALGQVSGWQQTGGGVLPTSEAVRAVMTLLVFGLSANAAVLAIPVLLALFGLLNTDKQLSGWWRGLFAPIWVILPLVLFLLLDLARPQNFKMLLPAQAAMSLWIAGGAAVLWRLPVQARSMRQRHILMWLARAAGAAAILWLLLVMVTALPALYSDPAFQRSDYRGVVRAIVSLSRDGDAIILDAPNQAEVFHYYYRGSLPVYGLPEGLDADAVETQESVQRLIDQYDRLFVIYWGESERDPQRIVETTLDEQTFEAADQWFGDVRLVRYVMPQSLMVENEIGARFGEHIMLESYATNGSVFRGGDAVQVRLNWSTDAALDERYKVFVQLLNGEGVLAAQRDSEPGGGLALTTTWEVDQVVVDNHALILSDDFPPGEYTLIVGLYPLDNPQARLPLASGGVRDYAVLQTIRVE